MTATQVTHEPSKMLLKPQAAADALSISPRKLWSLTAGGEVPCVRIGRSVRYDPADLKNLIAQQKQLKRGE